MPRSTSLLPASILHPTDFSDESHRAFAHALSLALQPRSRLTIAHVGREHETNVPWHRYPAVRQTLERWNLDFDELDLGVRKIAMRRRDATRALVDLVDNDSYDLVVLATHQREGLPRWLRPSVAEPVARAANTPCLFVGETAEGFVSLDNGTANLHRILVPLDTQPRPDRAISIALELAAALRSSLDKVTEICLLHASPDRTLDQCLRALNIEPEVSNRWSWSLRDSALDPVDAILDVAQEMRADMIVMSTAGHDGILDAFRGSTTEQVLRRAPCPLLAVPAVT